MFNRGAKNLEVLVLPELGLTTELDYTEQGLRFLFPKYFDGFALADGCMFSNQSCKRYYRRTLFAGDLVDSMATIPGQLLYIVQKLGLDSP